MKRILIVIITILFCSTSIMANYFVKRDGKYILTDWGDISANDAAKKMGLDTNMFYFYFGDTKNKSDIDGILFKSFSTEILCVSTNNNVKEIRQQDIDLFLANFDYNKEYSVYDIESDLKEGIEKQNFSISFIADAMNIKYNPASRDTILINERLKYNLYFKNGFLYKYESSDGFNRSAKEMKTQDPDYFEKMTTYAKEYWKDDKVNIINELNTQVEALYSMPDGFRNEHLSDFLIRDNLYNFKMLNVLYYKDNVTLREFKDVCHGDVQYIDSKENKGFTIYFYIYKSGIYGFSEDGKLVGCRPMK